MIELDYSLIIEATEEPDYFGFNSPDLEGFTGKDILLKIVYIRQNGE